nr:hypothetical protein [Tanacetum cinerariifolium]
MGGDGIGGGDGVLKAKESEMVSMRVSLEVIDDEDVPLLDGVLDDALVSWKLLRLRFEKMPWKYLRLKMSEEDDNLKNEDWEPFY